MKRVRVRWHTFEWFEDEFEIPDDVDLEDTFEVHQALWDGPLGSVDETLIDPDSYERDIETFEVIE